MQSTPETAVMEDYHPGDRSFMDRHSSLATYKPKRARLAHPDMAATRIWFTRSLVSASDRAGTRSGDPAIAAKPQLARVDGRDLPVRRAG
jgi:hypothetical protein